VSAIANTYFVPKKTDISTSIPWHVGQGLSWQFLERKDEILSTLGDLSSFNSNCDSWRKYWDVPANPDRPYEMDDSGL
jgi:hypothetical protein